MNAKLTLTSAETGKLWATYMGNTMSKCILNYYLKCVEDKYIKRILNNALNLSESFLQTVKNIFIQENFAIPQGFTEDDVNLHAPSLFVDEFYLHYLKYTGKAGLYLYEVAIPLVKREDIRNFFTDALQSTVKLMNDVNIALMEKGALINPPPIPIPEKVDFVKKESYLSGFFGDVRPLHCLEIAHLYDNLENDITSRAISIGFSQVAKDEEIKQYLLKEIKKSQQHIELCSKKLVNDNLPAPSLMDTLVTTSTVAPFSDKLMLFQKIDLMTMKIRSYASGASLNGRHDIGVMYLRFLMEMDCLRKKEEIS